MILRTYARVFTSSIDDCLASLERLVGKPADLRFAFGAVELAAVGNFLVIAGSTDDLLPLREGVGPVVVDDLQQTLKDLQNVGAVVEQPPASSDTGVFAYVRHPDGALLEYVQWKDELVHRIIGPY